MLHTLLLTSVMTTPAQLPGAAYDSLAMNNLSTGPDVLHVDCNWIMIDPGDTSTQALMAIADRWGLDGQAFEDSSVGRLIYAPLHRPMTGLQVLSLVDRLARSGAVTFASPLFLGGTRMLPWAPTNEVLLQLETGADPAVLETLIESHNLHLIDPDVGGQRIVRLGSTRTSAVDMFSLCGDLERHPQVSFAHSNAMRWTQTCEIPNDPEFGSQWGLHQSSDHDMDAPEAWDITKGSGDIQVVVLDSGIDQNHADINQLPGATFTGSSSDGHPGNDCDNHGTAVAGCVAATINNAIGVVGVAPECIVRAGKVFNEISIFGFCLGFLEFQDAWVVEGIGWAADQGARVTNSSWGGGSASGSISAAFNQTHEAGVVHVAAAGNDGSANIGWPANLANVLAVSAMQSNGTLASFSTYGNGLFTAAPGAGIRTTDRSGSAGYDGGDTTTIDGTSFSSPYVAGVMAMVLSMDASLSPEAAADLVAATAEDYGADGWDTQYGHGFVNVAAAVEAADPGTDCPADVTGDGVVDTHDILQVLSDWGPCEGCDSDIDGNGMVDVDEILAIIASFEGC
ncbi:MAG: S8 family serine peptidase [Phycisphaerales bacterium]|nr:S8 family serine peptidase [Phycisphaerales bacterium]